MRTRIKTPSERATTHGVLPDLPDHALRFSPNTKQPYTLTKDDLVKMNVAYTAQTAVHGHGAVNPKTARLGVWSAARMCVDVGVSLDDAMEALREDYVSNLAKKERHQR